MVKNEMEIRAAEVADMADVRDIYNDVIKNTMAVWRESPVSLQDREEWLRANQAAKRPVLVAKLDGLPGIVAFGALSPFRNVAGYELTGELTLHVSAAARGRGVGKAMLAALVDSARLSGYRVLVSAIDGDNAVSVRLHEQQGFDIVGRMPGVGVKNQQPRDLILMQLGLES